MWLEWFNANTHNYIVGIVMFEIDIAQGRAPLGNIDLLVLLHMSKCLNVGQHGQFLELNGHGV
jgi:hypothetical protein